MEQISCCPSNEIQVKKCEEPLTFALPPTCGFVAQLLVVQGIREAQVRSLSKPEFVRASFL